MPKSCSCCPFRKSVDYILLDWAGCQLNADIYKTKALEGRHKDCPLIEVKTPHGRCIDADDLKNEWKYDKRDSSYERSWVATVRKSINDAPTVIEAED